VEIIEILTTDKEWGEELKQILESRYGDIAQESIFVDRALEISGRLDEARERYISATLRRTQTSIRTCERLQKALAAAELELKALQSDLLDPYDQARGGEN
jgi:hypothetical protein